MRVVLTGANGFIGSHILDGLLRRGFDVAVLLRKTSNTRFIEASLPRLDVRYGSLESPESLQEAFREAGVVIHCAAKTKAVRKGEYYAVNADGTRNVVEACNALAGSVHQLVLMSSLSVSGPASVDSPVQEDAVPRPVSAYGKSKLLGEQHVQRSSRVPFTILRPAAVYGPRDGDLYLAFKMVSRGLAVLINGGLRALSLIYVADVVEGVLKAIGCARSYGKVYHLAHPVPSMQRALLSEIASAMGVRARHVVVPSLALYPAFVARELWSRLTCVPSIINLEKWRELRRQGWACSTLRAAEELGFVAQTPLDEGIRLTLKWYRDNGWL